MIYLNGASLQFESFPNGETRMPKITPWEISDRCHIDFKYQTDVDFLHLMFLKKKLDAMFAKNIQLAIWYMPYSRQDRVEGNSAFTLKYVCDFINSLNFETVTVYEPHSEVTAALLNNVTTVNLSANIAYAAMRDELNFDVEKDIVFFPDAGAQKRYASSFDKCKQMVGFKHRNFETGRIESYEILGDYNTDNAKVIIVDDLCSYGGTFVAAADALQEKGFKEIYLVIAHCEDSIFKGHIFTNSGIKKVFTSNSILSDTSDLDSNPIKITDIMEVA